MNITEPIPSLQAPPWGASKPYETVSDDDVEARLDAEEAAERAEANRRWAAEHAARYTDPAAQTARNVAAALDKALGNNPAVQLARRFAADRIAARDGQLRRLRASWSRVRTSSRPRARSVRRAARSASAGTAASGAGDGEGPAGPPRRPIDVARWQGAALVFLGASAVCEACDGRVGWARLALAEAHIAAALGGCAS
jgi:hypothetical protein